MEIINTIIENDLLFYSVLAILTIIFFVIIYFLGFKKNKKDEIVEYENKLDSKSDAYSKIENELTEDQKLAKLELQKVIEQMNEDIANKPKEAIDLFEQEQEENAIISYQELVNNVKNEKQTKIDLTDIYEKSDDILETEEIKEEIKVSEKITKVDEVSPIDKYIEKINEPEEENLKFDDDIESAIESIDKLLDKKEEKETKKFHTSDFVSPIYGKQEFKMEYPKVAPFKTKEEKFKDNLIEIENTLKMEPLTDEDKLNEEFLNALKNFRKNL